MSTNIRGWRVKISSMKQFADFVQNVKQQQKQKFKELVTQQYVKNVFEIYDRFTVQYTIPKEYENSKVSQQVYNKLKRAYGDDLESKKTEDIINYNCQTCFMFDKKYVYIMTFGETCWYDFFEEYPGTENYSYWNSTDKPDDISTREWNIRKKTWDRLVGNDSVANSSLSMKVVNGFYDFYGVCHNISNDVNDSLIPSFKQRVNKIKDYYVTKYMPPSSEDGDYMDHYLNWRWSDDFDRCMQLAEVELYSKLQQNITWDDVVNFVVPENYNQSIKQDETLSAKI